MLRPSRVFWLGFGLLALALVRAFACPFIDPADKENPGLLSEIYNFSILLWIPAFAVIALAGLLQIGRWTIRLLHRRNGS
jgi:hypothetical protein